MDNNIDLEKDLTLELNKDKVKCDPLNYTFKSNVFIKEENLSAFNINNTDISVIDEIIDVIRIKGAYTIKFLHTFNNEPKMQCINDLKDDYLNDEYDNKQHILYCTNNIIKSNNYYINPKILMADTLQNYSDSVKRISAIPFNKEYFYKNTVNKYIKMLVFDSIDTNLLMDILYLPYEKISCLKLEELRDLSYVYIEEPNKNLTITKFIEFDKNVLNIVPRYSLIIKEGTAIIESPLVTMIRKTTDTDDSIFNFIYLMFAMSIIYALEIFYVIKHSRYSDEVKDELISYFLDKENIVFKSTDYKTFSKYIYDYENQKWTDLADDVFNVDSLQERFNIYNKVFNDALKELKQSTIKDDYMAGLDVFPNTLCTLINYYQDTAHKEVMKKIALKLIDFCKNHNISLTEVKDYAKENTNSEMELHFFEAESEVQEESTPQTPKKILNNTLGSLNNSNNGIAFGKSNSGIKCETLEKDDTLDKAISNFREEGYTYRVRLVNEPVSNYGENEYNNLLKSINLLTKDLTRQIKNIKTYNTGGKMSGLKSGRLDTKRLYLYKQTDMLFYNNKYKIKEMDLAFGIILDESGSMDGEGIENGKITMILLHEVLKSLNVNHCIIGHNSSSYKQCNIHKYQPFKEDRNYSLMKCKNLINIEADDCNCDSGALYYMQKELNRVKNKDKICIVFSDGAPTHCSSSELKEQVKRMEKRGIRVIGIGINFENIKAYYPHNANGRNLKEMLDITTNILKEYVLEKVD